MARWLTAILLLAAALAAPAAARAKPVDAPTEAAAHETAACCGGACTCGPSCACAGDGSDAEPRDHGGPAPIRDRDERTLAVPLHRVASFVLAAARPSAAFPASAAATVRPAGRALLERIARWTT